MVPIRFLTLAVVLTSRVAARFINNTKPAPPLARVYQSCITPNTVALTFDDGPYIHLKEIVDLLDREKVNGTFFFNGLNWDCIYNEESVDRIRYAYDRKYLIGSHTWAHLDLANLTFDQVNEEMSRTELAIKRITGASVSFTRPPFGSFSQTVLDVSGSRNQSVVTWDFDSRDTANVTNQTQVLDEFITHKPTTILALYHETINTTVNRTLPYTIRVLKSKGYRMVTVAECLNLTSYLNITQPEVRNANWTC